MSNYFYGYTEEADWQQSSGPIISRDYHVSDLWPVGAHGARDGSAKDLLEDGLHPVVAIGPNTAQGVKANRPINLTGVVIAVTEDDVTGNLEHIVEVNLAEKVVVRNYVANITSYSVGSPIFTTSVDIGAPVYVDDSPDLSTGVTLSFSPLNDADAANPLAGYIYYCQDEFVNFFVGGPNVDAHYPRTVDATLDEEIYCVILTNDYGTGAAALT